MPLRKICIVEDNEDIREVMMEYLKNHEFEVECYESAEDFYARRDQDFKGLYLLDWHLPGEPGINIVSYIRDKDKISPIFMVSAFTKNSDIIQGLQAGADDYITKPFNFDELLVRVSNAYKKFDYINQNIDLDGIKLLGEASSIIVDGKTINLTDREYTIFEKLFEKRMSAVSRDDLISCFKNDDKITIRNIDVHVFSLRKKIKKADLVVDTIRGVGYQLN